MFVHKNDSRVANKYHVITEVARSLATHLDLADLLQAVLDKITAELKPAEFGVILFWDPAAKLFRPQAVSGSALRDREVVDPAHAITVAGQDARGPAPRPPRSDGRR